MNNNSNPEVLIVGAGPTGMVTAIELRRRGIECRIVERRSGHGITSRAITVHARTMEILDDMSLAPRFLQGGVLNEGYIFNFRDSDLKPRLDYTRLPTRYPFVCMFNQNETEKILRDHLELNLNLSIEWSTELTDISEDAAGKLTVALQHKADDSDRGDRPPTMGGRLRRIAQPDAGMSRHKIFRRRVRRAGDADDRCPLRELQRRR